jgi:predicted acyl esterase
VNASRSLTDPATGRIVQPYNDLSAKQQVLPGTARDYQVELWPIGNRFSAGHRIRLTLAGTPATFIPGLPAINSIVVGGPAGARLELPALPGSDLCAALGGGPCG